MLIMNKWMEESTYECKKESDLHISNLKTEWLLHTAQCTHSNGHKRLNSLG